MVRTSRLSIVFLAAALVACSSAAVPSVANIGSAVPSSAAHASRSPSASVAPEPTDASSPSTVPIASLDQGTRPIYQNWALASVRVNGLNVRTEPAPDAPLVRDEYGQFDDAGRVRLNDGDHVLVISEEHGADGMWWLMIAVQRPGAVNPVVVGWAAAGTRQDPWIEEDNEWCPSTPSLDVLLTLSGIERMGCYAAAPLTVEGYQATLPPDAGLGGACETREPSWLLCDHINYSWVNRIGGYDRGFLLHFDPATGIPETGLAPEGTQRKLRITGHFSDPASTRCAPDPVVTLEDHAAYLGCAVLFVVEHLQDG